ncbi:UspA domain protein [Chloroherpeton thalassium ATCC 35110]|uniref:Universal stress protein n=1 Tax=Chloroherpeton thalassium (strain ATCC 35110 / GB-78) TaxID=517418 RepID=B3QXP1_CHLT3|nr:universal stress protein [Chloroherpeton thalassium]ACF14956.1 UspA domain protein [Chloroherpeton thalassium ATCC 35110]
MFTIKKILCPTDFSDVSKNAVRYANEFARSMQANVIFLHVVEPRPIATDMTVAYIPIETDLEKIAEDDLSNLIEEEKVKGISAAKSVMVGHPSDIIIEQAESQDVDLIILGSHGRTGITRLLMGSVAEAVLRKAPCPVLIVKAGEKEFIHGDDE